MLNDATFSSPESAFYEYQIKMESQLCQVCNSLAAGFHHGAYVCEACKKFFKRYSTNQLKSMTICQKNCDLEKIGRRKCSYCRYKRCLNVGMKFSGLRSTESNIDISKIPCRVCGGKSSGFHFGSLTCEGCKGFFRRAEPMKEKLECVTGRHNCEINPFHKLSCKSCRYSRCVEVGMSKIGSRIGRQPNAVKHHCALEIINSKEMMISDRNLFEIDFPCVESNNSDSINDEIHRSMINSIPSTPINVDISLAYSIYLDGHLQDFFAKSLEAINTLQMPISEAEKLSQVTRYPVTRDQSLMDVWSSMMRHFDIHSHILVLFAKNIPGFHSLSLSDRRIMVQDAMYSIILLNLARSYQDEENETFNYFDFTKVEYDVILFHFPEMERILDHVIDISRITYKLKMNNIQIGLLCLIELCRNYNHLQSVNIVKTMYNHVVRLFWVSILIELNSVSQISIFKPKIYTMLQTLNCPSDLIVHISSKVPIKLEVEWCQKLNIIFNFLSVQLQTFNVEHQSIIDQLKKTKPELPYPVLYIEMFQLTPS